MLFNILFSCKYYIVCCFHGRMVLPKMLVRGVLCLFEHVGKRDNKSLHIFIACILFLNLTLF